MQRDDFIQRVNSRGASFLEARRAEVTAVSSDGAVLVDALQALMAGGKKLRPALAWVGWSGAGGDAEDATAVEQLGVALELFQAAALVHDDVIDRSATRRGQPSAHRRFEVLHARERFSGSGSHFGTSGAILAGDLALSWAAEAFAEAEGTAWESLMEGRIEADRGVREALHAARRDFQLMHTQVITGQYLDVLAEVSAPAASEAAARQRARDILRYKAAKYSTEYPIVIGAALAGAPQPLRARLAAAALPVGEAFQLRDDLLGVFGDPETTGKPVGDDLREGKRTELIAYGLFRADASGAEELTGMLGDDALTEADVERAREILHAAGAVTEVERCIEELVETSEHELAQLAELGVTDSVLAEFREVTEKLVRRTF